MYASGFRAKDHVEQVFVPHSHWVWTDETLKEFKSIYNQHFNNARLCHSTERVITFNWGFWGLFSELRDVTDVLMKALLARAPIIINEQHHPCGQDTGNPFMFCFFEPFTMCKKSDYPDSIPRLNMKHNRPEFLDSGIESLWKNLTRKGLRLQYHQPELPQECPANANANETELSRCWELDLQRREQQDTVPLDVAAKQEWGNYHCDSKAWALGNLTAQSRMSVLRALFLRTLLKPTAFMKAKLDEVRRTRAYLPDPMVVIHIRRTDKGKDGAPLMKQEKASDPKQTLFIIQRLLASAERLSQKAFGSIFVISDNPYILMDKEVPEILSTGTLEKAVVLMSRAGVDVVDIEKLAKGGHYSLPLAIRREMNANLTAEMLWAGERASYVIGNGRSGVSQALAQLIGARLRIDPNYVSLFEDDTTLLQCLEETKDVAWLVAP